VQEIAMSGVNGDKSRHHRMRKHKINQRERVRTLKAEFASAGGDTKTAAASPKKSAKPKQ
jgi:hypothetical protein